jgi:hypothetical protein
MAQDANKWQLIQFLNRRVWEPVLRLVLSQYPAPVQKTIARIQKKTETQRERYLRYNSAGQVRRQFEHDLWSNEARQTQETLQRLNLPAQTDAAEEFFRLADRLGVGTDRRPRQFGSVAVRGSFQRWHSRN